MGEFIMNNLALVMLFLASGVMLFWPEISRLAGGGSAQLGTLEIHGWGSRVDRLIRVPTSLVPRRGKG